MKIAVVGAGIFGVTVAIKLAEAGYQVDLLEKENDILKAASGINQYRLHRGYHYPRSHETIQDAFRAEPEFRQEYGEAVLESAQSIYGIAREGSYVEHEQFVQLCARYNLPLDPIQATFQSTERIAAMFQAVEARIDPIALRKICKQKLKRYRVNLMLNVEATDPSLQKYDQVVLCTYANLNGLLRDNPSKQRRYQFELCEKPVIRLPQSLHNKSIVLMDGPFFCVDPFGRTDLSVMGHVVHAIHQTNVGLYPEVDPSFLPLMNRGVVHRPKITNFKKFIEHAVEYIPQLAEAEHIGSMYTIRTVLPNVEKTDERPTIVERISDRKITVFSGKIGNCVNAAREVLALIQ